MEPTFITIHPEVNVIVCTNISLHLTNKDIWLKTAHLNECQGINKVLYLSGSMNVIVQFLIVSISCLDVWMNVMDGLTSLESLS